MSKKPTVLMILDGYGLNDRTDGNAVAQADIDGGLVGGASLKADFGKIVNYK